MFVVPGALLQRSEAQHRETMLYCPTCMLKLAHKAESKQDLISPSIINNIKNYDSIATPVNNIFFTKRTFHNQLFLQYVVMYLQCEFEEQVAVWVHVADEAIVVQL